MVVSCGIAGKTWKKRVLVVFDGFIYVFVGFPLSETAAVLIELVILITLSIRTVSPHVFQFPRVVLLIGPSKWKLTEFVATQINYGRLNNEGGRCCRKSQ